MPSTVPFKKSPTPLEKFLARSEQQFQIQKVANNTDISN
jgi:hypothetical protein